MLSAMVTSANLFLAIPFWIMGCYGFCRNTDVVTAAGITLAFTILPMYLHDKFASESYNLLIKKNPDRFGNLAGCLGLGVGFIIYLILSPAKIEDSGAAVVLYMFSVTIGTPIVCALSLMLDAIDSKTTSVQQPPLNIVPQAPQTYISTAAPTSANEPKFGFDPDRFR